MSIVTQYGERITDRVVITESTDSNGFTIFSARFDDEDIPGYSHSGQGAVRIAKAWLTERQRVRENEASAAITRSEDDFIESMADKLGVDSTDLMRLLEIAVRRAQ